MKIYNTINKKYQSMKMQIKEQQPLKDIVYGQIEIIPNEIEIIQNEGITLKINNQKVLF